MCGSEHIYDNAIEKGEWCHAGYAKIDCLYHLCVSCGHWWLDPSDPWPLEILDEAATSGA